MSDHGPYSDYLKCLGRNSTDFKQMSTVRGQSLSGTQLRRSASSIQFSIRPAVARSFLSIVVALKASRSADGHVVLQPAFTKPRGGASEVGSKAAGFDDGAFMPGGSTAFDVPQAFELPHQTGDKRRESITLISALGTTDHQCTGQYAS